MSQRQKQTSRAQRKKIAYDKTFGTPEGTDVLFDLMNSCNFTGSSVLDSGTYEPIAMAFRDGQKSIVAQILNTLQVDNTRFMEMMKQKHNEEQEIFE